MTTTALRTLRRHHHREFGVEALVEQKAGRAITVCLPARNEAATVGAIVERLRRTLVDAAPLVDEILVIDDHSVDHTAAVAADAGARVIAAESILPEFGTGHGKGEVLWKSIHVARGDLIAWCDADIVEFHPRFATGILGPLVTNPEVGFAKGFYARPGDGGRVTELVARPLLSLLMPHIAGVAQPLSGEFGGRRDVLERLPFVQGYGVDVALLIDAVALLGTTGVVEVDLDERHHRNRPLKELSPQAMAVAQTILRRAKPGLVDPIAMLQQADGGSVAVDVTERPPLVELDVYQTRTA